MFAKICSPPPPIRSIKKCQQDGNPHWSADVKKSLYVYFWELAIITWFLTDTYLESNG